MNAQASRADGCVLFQGVRCLNDFACGVQHGFPWRRHDAGNECRGALPCVVEGRNGNGVALVAVKEKFLRAVRVNVDQTRRNGGTGGKGVVGRAFGCEDLGNASVLNDEASVCGRAVAKRKFSWADTVAVRRKGASYSV